MRIWPPDNFNVFATGQGRIIASALVSPCKEEAAEAKEGMQMFSNSLSNWSKRIGRRLSELRGSSLGFTASYKLCDTQQDSSSAGYPESRNYSACFDTLWGHF